MAATESWTPSRRLQSAAVAERERIQRELARLDDRHAQLTEALSLATAAREELRAQLAVLQRLAHGADEKVPVPANGSSNGGTAGAPIPGVRDDLVTLRGGRIREAAVRTLSASPHAHEPVHYRDWYDLFVAEGFAPAGKDPLATFLTQVGRSPVVSRANGPGAYMLNHEYPEQARTRLAQLRAALRAMEDAPVDAGVEMLAATRERRSALATEIERLERDLEEALRSLGEPLEQTEGATS